MKTLAQKLLELIEYNNVYCDAEIDSDISTFCINGMVLYTYEDTKNIALVDENGDTVKLFKQPLSALKSICKLSNL